MRVLTLGPLGLIIFGFCLVVFGFVSIFGMVIRVIEPGLLLNFVGYGASFVGLLLGIIGVAGLTVGRRDDY